MKLDYIREFLVLADVLNYSRASSRLGVSQPVLTRHIQEMEKHFGVALFARSTRGISLTQAGRELVRSGGEVATAYEHMMARMQSAEQEHLSFIHVGVIPAVMFSSVSRASAIFREKFPLVIVKVHDLTSSLQLKALDSRQIDLALPGQVSEELLVGYQSTIVAEIPLFIALSEKHRLASRRLVDLADLSRDDFSIPAEKSYPGRTNYVKKACISAGFEPRITDHANGPSALLNSVSTGRYVSLLPALMQEMNHPGVVFRPLQQENLKVKSYAVSRLDDNREFIEAFINAITRASKDMYAKYNVHSSISDAESED